MAVASDNTMVLPFSDPETFAAQGQQLQVQHEFNGAAVVRDRHDDPSMTLIRPSHSSKALSMSRTFRISISSRTRININSNPECKAEVPFVAVLVAKGGAPADVAEQHTQAVHVQHQHNLRRDAVDATSTRLLQSKPLSQQSCSRGTAILQTRATDSNLLSVPSLKLQHDSLHHTNPDPNFYELYNASAYFTPPSQALVTSLSFSRELSSYPPQRKASHSLSSSSTRHCAYLPATLSSHLNHATKVSLFYELLAPTDCASLNRKVQTLCESYHNNNLVSPHLTQTTSQQLHSLTTEPNVHNEAFSATGRHAGKPEAFFCHAPNCHSQNNKTLLQLVRPGEPRAVLLRAPLNKYLFMPLSNLQHDPSHRQVQLALFLSALHAFLPNAVRGIYVPFSTFYVYIL